MEVEEEEESEEKGEAEEKEEAEETRGVGSLRSQRSHCFHAIIYNFYLKVKSQLGIGQFAILFYLQLIFYAVLSMIYYPFTLLGQRT